MKQIVLIFTALLIFTSGISQEAEWQTYYEKSGKLETPGYEATVNYCKQLDAGSNMITYTTFGKSPQGRDLPLLIIDKQGLMQPELIHRSGRVVLLIQACIHAGESEGKDAGLMLFRDLAFGSGSMGKLLDHVSILFIPIFNVDGHERFGPYNRINQNGPKEMGWRTTANNLNLNRDFLKADAPEMQAWQAMFHHWMPDFFIDCHTTDGADYQYVLTYLMEIYGDMDPGLTEWSKNSFIPQMTKHLNDGGYPVFPYVGFRNWHDPRSGLITEVAPPMLSQGYTALVNRPGLLIETHMLKPYQQRVGGTYECLVTSLEILNKEADKLKKLVSDADSYLESDAFLKSPFPLSFETSNSDSTMVEFLGMDYKMVKSDLSGGDWFQYSKNPATWHIPYFSTAKPDVSISLPYAYIIPAEWELITDRLKLHGIEMTTLVQPTQITVETYRFKNPKWQSNPYEGRHVMTNIEYDVISETRTFPAGSVIVRTNQQAGRIIPHLLEPKGNGSLVYWGFFDASFEQKEYGESYVIEKMAREMLAKNPALRKEFDDKKASDSVFARSPQQILNWFYNKSPYSDQRKAIYPVGRMTDRSVVEKLTR